VLIAAATLSGDKIAAYIGLPSIEAFRITHGRFTIVITGTGNWGGNCKTDNQTDTIYCKNEPDLQNALHEYGHVFDNHFEDLTGSFASGDIPWEWNRKEEGYMCPKHPCMAHSDEQFPDIDHPLIEEFADMYLNWVLHGVRGYPENGFDLKVKLGELRLRLMNGDPYWPYAGIPNWLQRMGLR
jgi:hypothetical protein